MSSFLDKNGLTYFWGKIKSYVHKIYTYRNPVIEKNLSGERIEFEDAVGSAFSSLSVSLEPEQSGTGDPSPSNVRAISGFSKVIVGCTGKNLWGGDALIADIKDAIPTATVDNENRTITFGASATVAVPFCGLRSGNRRGFQFEENKRYTFVFTIYKTSGTGSNIIIHYTDGTNEKPATSATTTKETLVIVSDEGKTVQDISKNTQSGNTVVYADECGIFEGVLTADDFEAYAGTEVSVQFPGEVGTVYGGTLDVVSGILTVTHGEIASYSGETLPGEWISDRDVYSTEATPTTGAQVVYEFSAPVIYQLTPAQVYTLLGKNKIWSSGANVSVRYLADAETAFSDEDYSDTVNTVPKATKAYAVGDYVSFGNVLCKATSVISAGDSIELGVNAEIVNIGDELNKLVSSMAYSESQNSGGGTTITIGE